MKTSKNLFRFVKTDHKENPIKVRSFKLVKTMIVIVMLSGIILLLPSCMVGFRTQGHERHGGNNTEHHDGGDRHGDNNHHDNSHDHDDHHDNR